MSKNSKVSVVIVNYNGEKFIADCIDSVLNSNYPNLEIIVVDNRSTDKSKEILQNKYGANSLVKLVFANNNLHFAKGSNLGFINSTGDKIMFLNSDTVIDAKCISELEKCFGKNKKLLVQPKILSFDNINIIDNIGGVYKWPGFGLGQATGAPNSNQLSRPFSVDYANGTCFMIKKQFFKKLGGFDNWFVHHYEDVDLSLRAKRLKGVCRCCPSAVIYHKESLSFKNNPNPDQLSLNIVKNQLTTIVKNFNSIDMVLRLTVSMVILVIRIIGNVISLNFSKAHILYLAFLKFKSRVLKIVVEEQKTCEIKRIINRSNLNILDVGCGEGLFIDIAKKHNIKASGVDSEEFFHPNIYIRLFKNYQHKEKYQVITMYHFLEHVANPADALEKASRLLKTDGTLVVEVPLVGNLSERILGKNYFAYQDKSHKHFFKKGDLDDLFSETKLVVFKKGFTLLEFPFYLLTFFFKKNILVGLMSLPIFILLKIFSLLGMNNEIGRYYLKKNL